MWALGWGAGWGGKGAGGWGKKGGAVEHKPAAGPPTPTGETYQGTVKSVSAKFGFIEAAEVTAAYGCDVFCLPSQLQGFAVGQQVEFSVGVNKEGKPQAIEVTAVGPPPPGAVTANSSGKGFGKWGGGQAFFSKGSGPTPTGEVYKGTIKSVSDRFGFIQCPEVEAIYGCDTFCLGNQLFGYFAGQRVEFSVGLNKEGKPQALDLKPIGMKTSTAPGKSFGKGGAWGAFGGGMGMGGFGGGWGDWGPWAFGPWGMGMFGKGGKGFGGKGKGKDGFASPGGVKRKPEGTGETFTGTVKSSSAKFGFIECEEVTAKYGQDCFCLGEQLVGFNVGDLVVFEVGVSPKGQPQALSVTAVDGSIPLGGGLVKRPAFKMLRTA